MNHFNFPFNEPIVCRYSLIRIYRYRLGGYLFEKMFFLLSLLPFTIDIDFSFVALISLNLARLGSVFEHKKENYFLFFFYFFFPPSFSFSLLCVVDKVIAVDVTWWKFSIWCSLLRNFLFFFLLIASNYEGTFSNYNFHPILIYFFLNDCTTDKQVHKNQFSLFIIV